jgi:hypothetical protein
VGINVSVRGERGDKCNKGERGGKCNSKRGAWG